MALLIVAEPDLGTTIVITPHARRAAGRERREHAPPRHAGRGAVRCFVLIVALLEPYRRARLTAFLDPWSDAQGSGFQSVQAMIAIGSGGPFGVGLGQSVQKLFYLPEAHTDMILAVIGEELGFVGIVGVLFLYGMIAYAGLRAARMARDLYSKLLAAGITSVILIQATRQLLRGAGRAAADRRAAAVHLLREQQPGGAARGNGDPDQRGPAAGGEGRGCGWSTAHAPR